MLNPIARKHTHTHTSSRTKQQQQRMNKRRTRKKDHQENKNCCTYFSSIFAVDFRVLLFRITYTVLWFIGSFPLLSFPSPLFSRVALSFSSCSVFNRTSKEQKQQQQHRTNDNKIRKIFTLLTRRLRSVDNLL